MRLWASFMELCRTILDCTGNRLRPWCCAGRCQAASNRVCSFVFGRTTTTTTTTTITAAPEESEFNLGTPLMIVIIVAAIACVAVCLYFLWWFIKNSKRTPSSAVGHNSRNSTIFSFRRRPRIIESYHPNGTILRYPSRSVNSNGPGRILERFVPTTPVPTASNAVVTTIVEDTTPASHIPENVLTTIEQDTTEDIILPEVVVTMEQDSGMNIDYRNIQYELPSYFDASTFPPVINSNPKPPSIPATSNNHIETSNNDDEPPPYEEITDFM